MDNLKVFENDEFGQLSVIVKNNKCTINTED